MTTSPEQAWEREMKEARRPSTDPARVKYPQAVVNALAAWKKAGGGGNR